MTPGDAIVLLLLGIALIRLAEILPKIGRSLGSYRREQDRTERGWVEEQYRLIEEQRLHTINLRIEEMNRQLEELREKERQRRSSPEFTLLRPSEDNHSATLLRASQSDTQEDDGASLLRAVTGNCADQDVVGGRKD
jgi:hypothetical protein